MKTLYKKLLPLDLIIVILIFIAAIYCIKYNSVSNGNTVNITADSRQYQFSLETNGIYSVQGPLGETKIEIKDRKVKIIDSPCPEKKCINQGTHSPIICLPNKVIVTIENYGDFDAVSE